MFGIIKNNRNKYYRYLIKENKNMLYGDNPKYKNQEPRLFEMYGKCCEFNKRIKIMIITDTHGCLKEGEFAKFVYENKEYDICLLLGDYSDRDINIILKYIKKERIYALLGNHDGDYICKFNLNNLNDKVIEINGVKLLGIQGSYRYKPEDFPSFSQKESIEFFNNKERVDILISHDSPYGMSDRNDNAHQGLFGITYYLFKNKVPYCIHGHLHTNYNKVLMNGTKIKGCYMYSYIELDNKDFQKEDCQI